MEYKAARYVNMVLGAWLLVSAFAWPHSRGQFLVTAVVGAVVLGVAPFAMDLPVLVRKINATAGVALVVAALALPRGSAPTAWHNVFFGLAIAAISFVGVRRERIWRQAHS